MSDACIISSRLEIIIRPKFKQCVLVDNDSILA
jgi:hypothetical protein